MTIIAEFQGERFILSKRGGGSNLAGRLFTLAEVSPSGCWEYAGARYRGGYGKLTYEGRTVRAHRASWELARGEIPAGMFVCHRCDNPPCIKPDHLFLGTVSDNVQDMVTKRRGWYASGPEHYRYRLTDDDVRDIRTRFLAGAPAHHPQSAPSLAAEYGVGRRYIWDIVAANARAVST